MVAPQGKMGFQRLEAVPAVACERHSTVRARATASTSVGRLFLREWSTQVDSLIAAARHIRGPSSGSTVGGNRVTTEISGQPPHRRRTARRAVTKRSAAVGAH
jgi:hypothetical protein